MKDLFSSCCGADNALMGPVGGDITWADADTCPECREECKFVESDELVWFEDGTVRLVEDGIIQPYVSELDMIVTRAGIASLAFILFAVAGWAAWGSMR